MMVKRVTFIIVALLAVCVLSPAASAARRGVEVSIDAERAKAKAEARLRKAAAKASRAARSAGVRINVAKTDGKSSKISQAAKRRDAIKRAIRKRLSGGNLAGDRR